jgi:2-hydroxy-3-oxopropionate reductase
MEPSTRIGFIGLGVMGLPMAGHLLDAGHELVVNTRTREKAASLEEQGAAWARSAREVAAAVDVVITMLPDSGDVEAVAEGADGLLAGARQGLLWIDMSSISPLATRRLAAVAGECEVSCLDAPVSGGEVGAKQATLTIMVGGDADDFAAAAPIFRTLGSTIVLVGDNGAGQVAKACNQLVVGGTIALVAEALVTAAKAGVDPARVRDALLGGFAQSRILEVHGERMLKRTFQPGFRVRLHQKDLAIGLELGRGVSAALPMTAAVSQLMNALAAAGGGDLDHSALATVYETLGAKMLADD